MKLTLKINTTRVLARASLAHDDVKLAMFKAKMAVLHEKAALRKERGA